MTDDLTKTMQRAFDEIRRHGGTATPYGGGKWKGADGCALISDMRRGSIAGPVTVGTSTIYALARRGLLKRVGKDKRRPWRDTYCLAESDEHKPRDYFVSLRRGERVALLAGPFATHAEALAMVDRARIAAESVDSFSWFDVCGTCSLPAGSGWVGVLNAELGVTGKA